MESTGILEKISIEPFLNKVCAFDVLIAGIAVANGAETLITRDRDFESIAKVTELDTKVY